MLLNNHEIFFCLNYLFLQKVWERDMTKTKMINFRLLGIKKAC